LLRRTLVRGDPNIFKDEGTEQESLVAGVGVEVVPQSRGLGRGLETGVQVDRRLRDRRTTQSGPQELHVLEFVLGDLHGVRLDVRVLKRHLTTTGHTPLGSGAPEEVAGQARTVDRHRIKLGLQVFQVQREVQDRTVAGPPTGLRQRLRGTEQRHRPHTHPGQTGRLQKPTPVQLVLGTTIDRVGNELLLEHRHFPFDTDAVTVTPSDTR